MLNTYGSSGRGKDSRGRLICQHVEFILSERLSTNELSEFGKVHPIFLIWKIRLLAELPPKVTFGSNTKLFSEIPAVSWETCPSALADSS